MAEVQKLNLHSISLDNNYQYCTFESGHIDQIVGFVLELRQRAYLYMNDSISGPQQGSIGE